MIRTALTSLGHRTALPLLLMTVTTLHAQDEAGNRVEIGAGYDWASGTTAFTTQAFPEGSDFESRQHSLSAHAGITLPNLFRPGFGGGLRLGYASGRTSHVDHHAPVLLLLPGNDPGGDPVIMEQQVDQFIEHRSWRIEAEGLARYSLVDEFAVTAGVAAGFIDLTDWTQSIRVTVPSHPQLSQSSSRTYFEADDVPGEEHVSLAGLVGLAGVFPIGEGFSIVPELRLRYDVIEPGAVGGWHPLSIQAMLSIGLGIGSSR